MLLKYLAPEGGTGITPPLARLGKTDRSNHAAVMNAVFKIYPSKWNFEAAYAGSGQNSWFTYD